MTDADALRRLRAPEAEVWVRLRPPTTGEMIGRGLQEELEFSDEHLRMCEWIADRHADATWDDSADGLRRCGEQLVAMVTPILDDREEVARRVSAWAEEWSI